MENFRWLDASDVFERESKQNSFPRLIYYKRLRHVTVVEYDCVHCAAMNICEFYMKTSTRGILPRYSGMSNEMWITPCLFSVLRIHCIEFNAVKRPNNTDTTAIVAYSQRFVSREFQMIWTNFGYLKSIIMMINCASSNYWSITKWLSIEMTKKCVTLCARDSSRDRFCANIC